MEMLNWILLRCDRNLFQLHISMQSFNYIVIGVIEPIMELRNVSVCDFFPLNSIFSLYEIVQ